jgi:16S rRNA (guanine966-N2)-methyltransferase
MDRLRQAVFSSLGECVVGAQFVDLFAGSGAYGLEAWSRGAAGGVFVEKSREPLLALQVNRAAVAKSLRAEPSNCVVVRADALTWTSPGEERVRLVFADPPYAIIESEAARVFAQFERLLEPGEAGLAVFEMPGHLQLESPGWKCIKRLGGSGPSAASACFYRRGCCDAKT